MGEYDSRLYSVELRCKERVRRVAAEAEGEARGHDEHVEAEAMRCEMCGGVRVLKRTRGAERETEKHHVPSSAQSPLPQVWVVTTHVGFP